MSSLRKLKRKAMAPKIKEVKKITADYIAREELARKATFAQNTKISQQACMRINTCVFKTLRNVFRMSGKHMCKLSEQVGEMSDYIMGKYVTYEELLDGFKAECKWKFPPRRLDSDKKRIEMTAAEMADYDARQFLAEASCKMEIMWAWTLHEKNGFSRVRLERFISSVREAEATLDEAEALKVNDWLVKHGIDFVGFDVNMLSQVNYYAKEVQDEQAG